MNTGTKTGIIITVAVLGGLTVYYGHISWGWFKKPGTETPPADEETKAPAVKPTVKTPGFSPTKPGTPAAPPALPSPGSLGTPVARKMGDKAFAGSAGANAYKTSVASQTNVYKFYAKAKYIGTYLGTEGTMTKLIVQEDGIIYGTNNKTVYVPTKDLTY